MIKRTFIFCFSILMIYFVTFNSCDKDERCPEWLKFTPVIYDTFLLEKDPFWKYDTNVVEIIDPDNKVITFFKAGNFRKLMNAIEIEYKPDDYENCIESGSNLVGIENELEHWYSVNSPVEIHLKREVYIEAPDSFNLDSIQTYHHGDRYHIAFLNPYGEFYIPEEAWHLLFPNQYIEAINNITLNGTTWKDVTHVYCSVSAFPAIKPYMKGIYLKKGVGLICFYSSDGRYWYLKI